MADATVSPRQRQTQNGRRAFLDKFPDQESKSAHFRDLARRSAEGRLVLSSDEAAALVGAYDLLARIAARVTPPPSDKETAAGGDPAAGEGRA